MSTSWIKKKIKGATNNVIKRNNQTKKWHKINCLLDGRINLPWSRWPRPNAPRTVSEIIGSPYLIKGDVLPTLLKAEDGFCILAAADAGNMLAFLECSLVVWTIVISNNIFITRSTSSAVGDKNLKFSWISTLSMLTFIFSPLWLLA